MLPTAEPQQIRDALARFDADLRDKPEWANWDGKRSQRFAIKANGRLYPVKQILAMASGQPVTSFSGGILGANKVLEHKGFKIVTIREPDAADEQPMARFREAVHQILLGYRQATTVKLSKSHPIMQQFEEAARALAAIPEVVPRRLEVERSAGKGNWAGVPWISLLDPRETDTTQRGVYVVYLFRGDMSGVYVTLNQGVNELKEMSSAAQRQEIQRRAEAIRARVAELAAAGFALDNEISLQGTTSLGPMYEAATIAHKFYATEDLPEPAELAADLHALLDAYASYVDNKGASLAPVAASNKLSRSETFERLVTYIAATGFVFEPWQLAAYVTALRTKPFVILAGVSGTGKSKLPQLIAAATGAVFQRVAVRPDWTDSSDVLGYVDLSGAFRPGGVLQFARDAERDLSRQHICLLDEMNLARVEQYFAELLSGIEDRQPAQQGGFGASRLLVQKLRAEDAEWDSVGWPPNLAVIGTVNMDETTHGFSRKVLDRSFTLEISDVDLGNWKVATPVLPEPTPWTMESWYPRALRLSDLRDLSNHERSEIAGVVKKLTEANEILAGAQLQVGYRVRDEISLFVLHAQELTSWFRTQPGALVAPLDLALHMKLLPRIAGGSGAIRSVLLRLIGWSIDGKPDREESDLIAHFSRWVRDGRSSSLDGVALPRTAARLCLMWERLQQEGFTSYWL